MAKRSKSQRIGSLGQNLVRFLFGSNRSWVPRAQDEDFGIDIEAELVDPDARGEILKVQIKSTEAPDIMPQGVKAVVETKYLRLSESYRVPLIFVLADTTDNRAWYLWLQGWLVDQRRMGKSMDSFGESITVYIPATDTLCAGLEGPLKEIARWAHENQMVLSLMDTMRTAIATRNENVLLSLAALIGSVDGAYGSFRLYNLSIG